MDLTIIDVRTGPMDPVELWIAVGLTIAMISCLIRYWMSKR